MNDTKKMAGFTAVFLLGIGFLQVLLGEYQLKSVALTANGIDCIGDGFVSSIVWIGLKVFHKPADHKFHYGYFKLENLASIAAAVIMVVLAIYITYRSYLQYTNPHAIQAPLVGIVIAAVAALVAIFLGISKYSRAKKTQVGSSKLEAINTIKDGGASVLAVVALFLADAGILIADAVVGFIIAGIILSIAFAAIKEASLMLVDACDSTCIDQGVALRNIMYQFPEVKASHMVRLRRTGPYYQGDMLIEVSGDMTIAELDKLTKDMEDWAKKKIDNLHNLTIKAVPYKEKE
jgi:cation diffusion facilitator family transporter